MYPQRLWFWIKIQIQKILLRIRTQTIINPEKYEDKGNPICVISHDDRCLILLISLRKHTLSFFKNTWYPLYILSLWYFLHLIRIFHHRNHKEFPPNLWDFFFQFRFSSLVCTQSLIFTYEYWKRSKYYKNWMRFSIFHFWFLLPKKKKQKKQNALSMIVDWWASTLSSITLPVVGVS